MPQWTQRQFKRPRAKQKRVESPIQIRFLTALVPILRPEVYVAAIPNGGWRSPREAKILVSEGVRRGATDVFFIAPHGVSAWLETKTMAKGSRLSDDQEGFRAMCLRNGHLWGMYRTVDEGVDQVRAWGFLKEGY